MKVFVYFGAGEPQPFDHYDDAEDAAIEAIKSAVKVHSRFGFVPYWVDALEIYRISENSLAFERMENGESANHADFYDEAKPYVRWQRRRSKLLAQAKEERDRYDESIRISRERIAYRESVYVERSMF